MKTSIATNRRPMFAPSEKDSEELLMEKMGLSKKELQEISDTYGVSAAKLIEIMSLSKYEFVVNAKMPGQCKPCHYLGGRAKVVQFYKDIA